MKAIADLFTRVAPVYDALNHLFSFGSDRTWRQIMVSAAIHTGKHGPPAREDGRPAQRTPKILDVCTGTGDSALALAAAGAAVTGVDLSEGMLQRAHAKVKRRHCEDRVELTLADALDLPFPDACFDGVTIAFGLRNLPDRPSAVREMCRVLRPGGRVVILEFAPPPATLFGRVFNAYLERIIPVVGRVLSGSQRAYRYLFTSIAGFHTPDEIVAMMGQTGLERIRARGMMGGIVFLYTGHKPGSPESIDQILTY